ncbi:septum formation protein [Microbacteriaceae bacterium SG_E_30_P1]|uniref:Nucleoside triphosphate pyrophosphatase n=1 Tax=Antiquaquibacter oligotrophicus TaxID=2880260 RepID=A0ABT6KP30_9MICO|nr:nucleoside triphosphate pyrophosphatase [Antiquaquibacter oligotrophicus]MDH6181745.1 septum formation protein [Antiquaquibacter oligotrophicus]UDF12574.1 Maf family nucleotide pyrophosphatase [Antiquaquibacter oligotrophicus]
MRFYLASTSPARLMTLRNAGVEPVVVPSEVDEDAILSSTNLAPRDTVELLARAKAEGVVSRDGATVDGVILGGDSMFEFDGEVYGKPHRPEVALERWKRMRGRSGTLHSGHWVIDHRGGQSHAAAGGVSSAVVTFADDIDDDELEAYISTREPLSVAGAFTIDSLGSAFITSVDGDPHAVVGLSVSLTRSLLRDLGIPWTAFWNR